MKYFLFLAATAGFLLVLISRAKTSPVSYDMIVTDLENVQEEIVDLHNNFRRSVKPTASNMLKMGWSEEAAANTKALSSFCDMKESNAIKRRIKNTFCGENKYLTPYPMSWEEVIGIWYNESFYFKYGDSSEEERKTADRYTQLVWATSYLIGCDVSPCCKRSKPKYLYICHYCHEGNDKGLKNRPYNSGNPCEDCPDNCEDKLCTNPCHHYDEYINCDIQKVILGCSHKSVQLQCKATCFCTDKEIS